MKPAKQCNHLLNRPDMPHAGYMDTDHNAAFACINCLTKNAGDLFSTFKAMEIVDNLWFPDEKSQNALLVTLFRQLAELKSLKKHVHAQQLAKMSKRKDVVAVTAQQAAIDKAKSNKRVFETAVLHAKNRRILKDGKETT